MLMKATAVHKSSAITPSAEIGSPAAKSAIVARRARVPDQPRRMKNAPGSRCHPFREGTAGPFLGGMTDSNH
ncbi:MAG TPA: hypothetical protein VEW48_25830 [Thermoanaerobaculia bacterium]|nr:hypothetical protein [Thermoanaerobaculia bacterium]